MADTISFAEAKRRVAAAARYLEAVEKEEDEWNEAYEGIYENIVDGRMDCDETGTQLWLTPLGRMRVETMIAASSNELPSDG